MPQVTAVRKDIDILGLGAIAADDFIYVASYPQANSKARVLDRARQCGGLTATALVAAARLGCRCAYAGVAGTDETSDFALAALAKEDIRTDLTARYPGCRIHHSTIIVDRIGNRTLLSDGFDLRGAGRDWPEEKVIRAGSVLFVDHTDPIRMVRAAGMARRAGIPVVADIERDGPEGVDELLKVIDHLIVPEAYARAATGLDDPAEAAAALRRAANQVVVVTCGAAGSWYSDSGRKAVHCEAYNVPVQDTTGCGDVFHGAYAAGIVLGLGLDGRVRLAAAAAALKATRRGGQAGCPNRREVTSFLRARNDSLAHLL